MSRRRAAAGIFLGLSTWLGRAHAADDELSLDLGEGTLELRHIPKGTFTQGSPSTEAGREADESARNVTITRSFWLGQIPVTRWQFARFVTETRHVTDAERGQAGGFGWDSKSGTLLQKRDFSWRNPGFPQKDEDPVVLVTFGDANAFTTWASRKTGRRVRLPTEAEWEYAARAGTTTPWYGAGKEEDALALGWFKTNALSSTHPVGLKRPNAWGLFDMSGNVYQWCRDVYAPYPPGDATDPESSTNAGADPERRVLRGGSWFREPRRGRSAARHKSAPGSRNADYGFRVAVDDDGAAMAPAPGSAPKVDVAPAAPIGAGSSSTPSFGVDASVSVVPTPSPTRTPTEGSLWGMLLAPIAGAGAAVTWVLARRGRRPNLGIAEIAAAPLSSDRARPAPREARRPLELAVSEPVIKASTEAQPARLPSVTGLAAARHAVVDEGESEGPFEAPLSTPETFVHPTSVSSPVVTSQALPSSAIISVLLEAASPSDSTRIEDKPHVDRSEPEEIEPLASEPKVPANTSEPVASDPTTETAGAKTSEMKAFDAWIAAAKAEAAKASLARLAAASAKGETKLAESKASDVDFFALPSGGMDSSDAKSDARTSEEQGSDAKGGDEVASGSTSERSDRGVVEPNAPEGKEKD